MESAKSIANRIVENLPEDVTPERLLYRIYVDANATLGLAEIDAGMGIPNDQMIAEMDEWLKSYGRQDPVAICK